MTTAVDYIRLALKAANVTGIGQTPDAEDTSDCLFLLQSMLNQWSMRKFLTPNEVDTAVTTTGASSYTVGSGGAFNITHPDRIEAAYIRLLPTVNSQSVDIPLAIIDAHEDYAA